MRIDILYSTWDLNFWGPIMRERYGMSNYTRSADKGKAVVFFGCYSRGTKDDIMNHQGLSVIVWAGSDSTRLHEHTDFIEYLVDNSNRVFHIAHSHWIQTDLKHWGLSYIDRVVLPMDLSAYKFEPNTGTSVYHYGSTGREFYYGTTLIKKLRTKMESPKVIITNAHEHGKPALYEIYKDCFVGVRLTEHDNMALSCVEMGLMGRRSIFNGDIPCAIPYPCHPYDRYEPETRKRWVWQDESLLGIVEKMILEMDREPDKLLAEEMAEFIYDDEEWLDTKFYE